LVFFFIIFFFYFVSNRYSNSCNLFLFLLDFIIIRSYSTGPFAARIDPSSVPFLQDGHIDGISLEGNTEFVKELQVKLANFNRGSFNFFSVNWPVTLDFSNVKKLTDTTVLNLSLLRQNLRGSATCFTSITKVEGEIFMENVIQHIFIEEILVDCLIEEYSSKDVKDCYDYALYSFIFHSSTTVKL